MRRFESPERLPPDLRSTRYYLFEGGCVTYEFAFDGDASASLMFEADQAIAFQPRDAAGGPRQGPKRAQPLRRRGATVSGGIVTGLTVAVTGAPATRS